MKTILVLLVTAFVSVVNVSAQEMPSGNYILEGVDGRGNYEGFVVVREGTLIKGTKEMLWQLSSGNTAVGFIISDKDHASVMFNTDAGLVGLVQYVLKGKSWEGRWMLLGGKDLKTEKLTFTNKTLKELRAIYSKNREEL